VIHSATTFRSALTLLRETGLDVPLFGRALDASAFHADDVPLAAALALLIDDAQAFTKRWRLSETLHRDIATLQRLRDERSLLDLYDAGERIVSQLPSMLRALGRDDRIELPDFTIQPFLTGDEIASIARVEPGPRIGALKRALLEAQLEGRVTTRDAAEHFIGKQ
jgi:hypothetical protein